MIREGYIRKIIYQNDDNGYSVFVVEETEGDEVFVGTAAGIAEGMYIQADGEYVHHQQYDIQFKMNSFELSMPDDIEGIERFLGSGAIKGIGEALAKRIIKKFKSDTLRIIDEEPERLAEVKGISETAAERIALYYQENRSFRNVVMFFSGYGISTKLAIKIYKEFGDTVYQVVRKNPYEIADRVEGVGFKKADEIAMKSGIQMNSEFRVKSAVLYQLRQFQEEGHMYVPEEMLTNSTYHLLTDDSMDFESFSDELHNSIMALEMDSKVVVKKVCSENAVYLRRNYYVENASAEKLMDLKMKFEIDENALDKAVEHIEKNENITLEPEQKTAIENSIRSGVAVITGGPGTGKTTIIRAVIEYFIGAGIVTLIAAPTGRAAKRINESTGYEAKTIHRMLEFSGIPAPDGKGTIYSFVRNEENPLECGAVIIDEASMIDSMLFLNLLKAIPDGTRLVLVGDTDQLPSVGAGNVLADIISSECFSVTKLNRIFRQGEESSIVGNAHKIRNGEHLEVNNNSSDFFFFPSIDAAEITEIVKSLIKTRIPNYFHIPQQDIQVMTPMRKYALGVEELNKKLQQELNPEAAAKAEKRFGDIIFREGDKIMQIRNNYKQEWHIENKDGIITDEGVGVFNGDMGVIKKINDFDEKVIILFDDGRVSEYSYNSLDELEHAFAITIHKSQGSEYPAVIIPLLGGPPKLLNRNLIYTAITRARKIVAIVGDYRRVNEMIDNINEQKRYTSFDIRLVEIEKRIEETDNLQKTGNIINDSTDENAPDDEFDEYDWFD